MGLRQSRVVPPLAVALLVAAMALIPALRDHRFYLTDDSAAQFLPSWYHLGELLRSGQFPLLDPTLWAGGNIAAEALFGIWNPVLLATMVFVSLVPNLVVASVVVKTVLPGAARARRLRPGPRVRRAARVLPPSPPSPCPFAGVTLYFDAASWSSGLTAFAFVPWFWWTLRRCARGELTPLVPFVAGYLAMTAGNPYGALGACLAVVGLCVEFAWTQAVGAGPPHAAGRDRRRPRGAADLPAAGAHPVRHVPERLEDRQQRAHGARAGRPAQRVHAQLRRLGGRLRAPVPDRPGDLPGLVRRSRCCPGCATARSSDALASRMAVPVYTVIGLAFSVGPSEAWMFRWPLRVVPYFVLPTAILLAIALAQGLAADNRAPPRGRLGAGHPGRGVPGRGDPPGPRVRPPRVDAARRRADGRRRGRLAAVARPPGRLRGPARGVRGRAGVPGHGVPAQPEPQRLPVPHERGHHQRRAGAALPRHRAAGREQRRRGALPGSGRPVVRGDVRQHAAGGRGALRHLVLRHGVQGVHRRAVHRVQRLGLPGRPAAGLGASGARRASARRPAAAGDRRRPERPSRSRRRPRPGRAGASPSAPPR